MKSNPDSPHLGPLHEFLLYSPVSDHEAPISEPTPSRQLATAVLAPADASTIALLARLVPGIEPPLDAARLLARIGAAFDITAVDPQGAIGLAATLLVHRLATLEDRHLHLTAAGRTFAARAHGLVRVTDALDETGGLVTPEHLWRALAADTPATTGGGSRPALRRLLARCLEGVAVAEGLGALPPEAFDPWLDHLVAAALYVGETTALFDRLVTPATTEALVAGVALPDRHPWSPVRMTSAGARDLLAALAEFGVVEALDDTWRLSAGFASLLTGDAPQRSVVASLCGHGFLTPTRLRAALDATTRHGATDQMTADLRSNPAGSLQVMHGTSINHARALACSTAVDGWMRAHAVAHLVSIGSGSGVVPLGLSLVGGYIRRADFLDLVPENCRWSAEHWFPTPEGQRRHFVRFDVFVDRLRSILGPLPDGVLVELGNVLHHWTPEQNVEILSNIAEATRGGQRVRFAITERFLAEDPAKSALIAVRDHQSMQVWTKGQQYRPSDLFEWLSAAGFEVRETAFVAGDDGYETALIDVRRKVEVSAEIHRDETLVDILRRRAAEQPDDIVYTHLVDGETEEIELSFAGLWQRSLAVAQALREAGLVGQRAIIVCPPGLDFAPAFFGCQVAGVVAAPAAPYDPSRPQRSLARLRAIAEDARPRAILTTADADLPPELGPLLRVNVDRLPRVRSDLDPTRPDRDALAYLQYTSGSTADPKGVMVTHGNLWWNCLENDDAYAIRHGSIMVCWVPPFHDMGLLYAIAAPLFGGARCISLAASDFLRRPIRWFRVIHRYRATHTVAPNAAYDLAVTRTTPEERAGLNLETLHMALNGAEPIRAETERRLVETFAPFGLRAETMSHALGLAENTAVVTAERPGATAETFGGRLEGEDGRWLRTGDLGFVREGRVYVTGRLKDVIIIRGLNHYPQDLEASLIGCHPALRPGLAVAIGIPGAAGESLAIIAEIRPERLDDPEAVVSSMLSRIAEHGLRPAVIALCPPGTVEKTTSGKPRRRAMRQRLLDDELETLERWDASTDGSSRPSACDVRRDPADRRSLSNAVLAAAAAVLGDPRARIDPERPLQERGFDSTMLAEYARRVEVIVGRALPTAIFFDYPSPSALVDWLIEGETRGRSIPALAPPTDEPIVIAGMACRLPGADSPESLWRVLDGGIDVIDDFPSDRGWDAPALFDPDPEAVGRTYVTRGGFIDAPGDFDAGFFDISPREARLMDPQQRLLLELAWEGLERAGVAPASLKGERAGVFVGLWSDGYDRLAPAAAEATDGYALLGSAPSVAAGRVAYALGLEGPAVTVDTACSSSLVAVHQAAKALRDGECDIALAGGQRSSPRPTRSSGSAACARWPPADGAKPSPPAPTARAGPKAPASSY